MLHAPIPFVIGRTYLRADLLAFVGSGRTIKGTIHGPLRPDCLVLTTGGKNARRAGYADHPNDDGTFTIHGEGQKGNQDPNVFANRMILEEDRLLLLFKTEISRSGGKEAAWQRYLGEYRLGSWMYETPTSGVRQGNQLLQFVLHPVSATARAEDESIAVGSGEDLPPAPSDQLNVLRDRAKQRGGRPVMGTLSAAEYRRGSWTIRRYAALRANGVCEYKGCHAPFVTPSGQPYLEVHHIFRLADDGPDAPENVAALCPNCHREAHLGSATEAVREQLATLIRTKEAA